MGGGELDQSAFLAYEVVNPTPAPPLPLPSGDGFDARHTAIGLEIGRCRGGWASVGLWITNGPVFGVFLPSGRLTDA